MANLSLRINVEDAQRDFRATSVAITRAAEREGPIRFGRRVVKFARLFVPVVTGRLKRSIALNVGPRDVRVEATAPYARFVEARRMFLGRALRAAEDQAHRDFEAAIDDAIPRR